MAGCRAVSLRKRNFMELSFGPFSGCKNLVQQIMWIISEWEETAVESAAEIGHIQVQEAERTLYEAKKKLWRLWTTAFQKIEDAQRGGEPRAGHGVTTTSQTAPVETYRRELIVREDNCAALETQREARQRTVVINHSPHTSPLKNLMLEWSVLLDDKGRLCLQGVIPTKGEWVTTPIAQRLDQTKVKTISGTIYNVWGPMVIPPDLNIPKFVQDAFQTGIPVGWKTIVNDWYTFIKQELDEADNDSEMKKVEYPRNSVTTTARQQLAVNDNRASNINYNDQQRSRVELPPPKGPPPKRRYVSEAENRKSVARKDPIPNKQGVAEAETAKDAQNKAELVRYSQRVLNKSVLNNTINEGDEEKSAPDSQDIKFLKLWSIEFSYEYNGLILKGRLISEGGEVMEEEHKSSCICSRLQPDLVETEDGFFYRLVGPSSLVFSENKDLDYGFPLNWKQLIPKYQKLASDQSPRSTRSQSKRLSTTVQQSNVSRNNRKRRAASTSMNRPRNMHQEVMIRQLVKKRLYQGLPAELDGRKNGSMSQRGGPSSAADQKRKLYSANEKENKGHIKQMGGSEDPREANDALNQSLDSTGENEELEWKKKLLKNVQNTKSKSAEASASRLEERKSEKEDEQKTSANKQSSNKKNTIPYNTKHKYVLGLQTDDCESDSEFNIF